MMSGTRAWVARSGALALIAGAVWVVSGAWLPWAESVLPEARSTSVPVIRANLPDEPGRPSAPRLGMPTPDFEWQEPDGAKRKLSDLRGRVVVVNFWATWCPPCRAEMPAMENVARASPEVTFLMIDLQEDEPQVLAFFERFELRHLKPVIDPDGETSRRYALASLPQTFFVDPEGVIRHLEIGGPIDEQRIREGIRRAGGR